MITIKGINKNNELEYEFMGGKLQHANQLIITDTINKEVIYDKTIDTFLTSHKIPDNIFENGKTYKLLLLALDEDNNFIGESEYYYIPIKNNIVENKLKMRIKYFEGSTKLQKIVKGNWIDVYSNKDVFVPVEERAMIPLGFALELPQGWEGHLAPRSSTFKTWGIIQTNHVGVVDDTYIGDNDQWHMPVYCLQGKEYDDGVFGTWIRQGDKIGQFRIMEVMPEIEFEEVETFGNTDRGGFGTTGVK